MASDAESSGWAASYAGTHCVVLGGCGGLGSTLVKALVNAQAKVTVIDACVSVNPFPRKDVEEKFNTFKNQGILCFKADSTMDGQVDEAMEVAVKKYGKVDTYFDTTWRWVFGPSVNIMNTKKADWETSSKNVYAPGMAIKAIAPHMKKGSSITIVGGLTDQKASPLILGAQFGVYHAARNQLVREAAVELAPRGIRVNCVNAGCMKDTPIYQALGSMTGSVDNFFASLAKSGGGFSNNTMQRAGTSQEIGDSFLFLASKHASYITGQRIYCDGGVSTGIPMDKCHGGFTGGLSEKQVQDYEDWCCKQ